MVIRFGDIGPDPRQESLDQVRELGQFFVGLSLDRKEKEERRRRQELQRAYKMLSENPEIVDHPQGEALGEKFPELAPMVHAARNRSSILKKVRGAGESWLSEADRRAKENQESVQRQMMLSMPTSPFSPPNLQAMGSAFRKAQVHPDQHLQEAAESLPPSERVAANIWARSRGLKAPEPQYQRRPDPFRDLPQSQRALRIPGTPEQERAARIGARLEEPEGTKKSRALSERRADLQEWGLRLRERDINLDETDSRTLGSMGYKTPRKFFGASHDAYLERIDTRQEAWDEELEKLQDDDLLTTEEKEGLKKDLTFRLGPRPKSPPKMLPGQMNRITRKILDEAGSPEEIEQSTEIALEAYRRLTIEEKLSPADAVAVILGEKDPPTPRRYQP